MNRWTFFFFLSYTLFTGIQNQALGAEPWGQGANMPKFRGVEIGSRVRAAFWNAGFPIEKNCWWPFTHTAGQTLQLAIDLNGRGCPADKYLLKMGPELGYFRAAGAALVPNGNGTFLLWWYRTIGAATLRDGVLVVTDLCTGRFAVNCHVGFTAKNVMYWIVLHWG